MKDIENLKSEFESEISNASSQEALQNIKSKYLGKNGLITKLLKGIKDIPPQERKDYGRKVNELKAFIETHLREKQEYLKEKEIENKLKKEWIDLTVPVKPVFGSLHPITQTLERILGIFRGMGFSIEEGPEIELEDYNFDKLNIPQDHPARDMQDTFYVNKEGYLLRTHTSPVQIRTMLSKSPPIQMVAPGKVYRRDDDPTHSPMFHQVEGLVVNEYANFRHMKFVIEEFLREFFQTQLPVRFRTSYFPFTEPSAEVDIGCVICGAKGCRVCKDTGWLEVMGCGMVHPNVLESCGVDTEVYQGFAFGMGVERLAMLLYGIDNIKLFYENDIRFLRQF